LTSALIYRHPNPVFISFRAPVKQGAPKVTIRLDISEYWWIVADHAVEHAASAVLVLCAHRSSHHEILATGCDRSVTWDRGTSRRRHKTICRITRRRLRERRTARDRHDREL
jgi:hypothetical protein